MNLHDGFSFAEEVGLSPNTHAARAAEDDWLPRTLCGQRTQPAEARKTTTGARCPLFPQPFALFGSMS